MNAVTVTLKGPLFQPARVQAEINRLVDATLTDLGAFAQRLVQDKTPHGASFLGAGLSGSVYHELIGHPAHRGVLISHGKSYGDIVEVGRRPGRMPPYDPILAWVKAKTGLQGRPAASFARYVVRKIGARGYAGAFMFARSMPAIRSAVHVAGQKLRVDVSRAMTGSPGGKR